VPISDRPWGSISESDYTPEQFCRAALIDLNPPGEEKVKGLCKLPVREPNGALNRNGVHAAAGRFGQTDAPPAAKRAAARRLMAAYAELDEEPPESVMMMAR